ncbi:MAG: hypothetical protein U1E30_04625 [Rhodoblastus sp.]
MRVDLQRAGDVYRATVRGASIDARPFIKSLGQTGASQKGADFELDLKSPILTGFSKQALTNADIKATRRGGFIRQFAASGQFGRGAVSAQMAAAEGGRPQIEIGSSDAGFLLAFADVYSRMEGGTLNAIMSQELTGLPAQGNPSNRPCDTNLSCAGRLQVLLRRCAGRQGWFLRRRPTWPAGALRARRHGCASGWRMDHPSTA